MSSSDKHLHVKCLERFLRRYVTGKIEVSSILHDISTQIASRKLSEAGTLISLISSALTSEGHPVSENLQRFVLAFHERFAAIGACCSVLRPRNDIHNDPWLIWTDTLQAHQKTPPIH